MTNYKKYRPIVAECLKAGWRWYSSYNSAKVLMPPSGDIRHMWCAEWIIYRKDRIIPHWISPEVPK